MEINVPTEINKNQTSHLEFEIVRLKDASEETLDSTSESNHRDELKLGTYILIKKEFKKTLTFKQTPISRKKQKYSNLISFVDFIQASCPRELEARTTIFRSYLELLEELEIDIKKYDYTLTIEDEIVLYYRKILVINKENDKLQIEFCKTSEYSKGWSAKYKCMWDGETPNSNRIAFANKGVYEIEEELQNKDLGSYLLREILLWGKQNYENAIANISTYNASDEDHEKREHFYGKANLEAGVKIEDTITDLGNIKKLEIISCEDFINNLLIYPPENNKLHSIWEEKKLEIREARENFFEKGKFYISSIVKYIFLK
jgi:hypothetical protein